MNDEGTPQGLQREVSEGAGRHRLDAQQHAQCDVLEADPVRIDADGLPHEPPVPLRRHVRLPTDSKGGASTSAHLNALLAGRAW